MRISLKQLRNYVDISIGEDELSERLTMVGFEVENIDRQADQFKNFVVGEILDVRKHPNADRLTLCTVSTGREGVQIVCGAPNVAVGQKVAVGLPGAIVPHNQHDPEGKTFTLAKARVRDQESNGMICSQYELGLGPDKSGIMVLDESNRNPVVGIPLATYFGLTDVILEVGVTPNRPDALSHFGIAREVGAMLNERVRLPQLGRLSSRPSKEHKLRVSVHDHTRCPRYTARVIRDVQVNPSPAWLQDFLKGVGIRPINNIVDITNFVLMEIGQPLHAFDYDLLKGNSIHVRCARPQEQFVTLDGKSRTLRDDILMICDEEQSVAIAGVMGGANCEISNSTQNIVLESAYFNSQNIRRTAKYLGISTDASQRYERGADPNIVGWAADRAAELMQEIAEAQVIGPITDLYPKKVAPKKVSLRVSKTNELIGTNLDAKTISSLLKKIEIRSEKISVKSQKSGLLNFIIPTFRPDVEREVDLIEEVARLYGFDQIETNPRVGFSRAVHAPSEHFTDELLTWLSGSGYREVISNSMQDKSIASLSSEDIVEISNPISKEMGSLRTSLLPGMLAIVRNNIFHGAKNLRLFEQGRVYKRASAAKKKPDSLSDFVEEDRLILLISGLAEPVCWDQKSRSVDFYQVKGGVETLLQKISLDKFKFIPYSNGKALTQMALTVDINGESAGVLGQVRNEWLRQFEIEQPVFVAELALYVLKKYQPVSRRFRQLPKFPAVQRDLAFVVSSVIAAEAVRSEILKSGSSLLQKVELFDVYQGDQLDSGKKSYAFALEFLAEDHTMTQEEIERLIENVISHVSRTLGATVRK